MKRWTVAFTASAERDLAIVIDTITDAAGSRVAARWRRRLLERAGALALHPHRGALDDLLGPGRRRVIVSPYLIVYEFQSESDVVILRIIDGARDLPALFGGDSRD